MNQSEQWPPNQSMAQQPAPPPAGWPQHASWRPLVSSTCLPARRAEATDCTTSSASAPPTNHPPVDSTPSSPGKGWWRANAALYVVGALLFGVGVAACVHWVRRSSTEAFADANPQIAKYQFFYVIAVLGLACLLSVAAVLSFVGSCGRHPGSKTTAVLMVPCVLLGVFTAYASLDEFVNGQNLTPAQATVSTVMALVLSGGAVLVASCASNTASPRPPRPRPEDVVRRRYPGRPPYPPPGR